MNEKCLVKDGVDWHVNIMLTLSYVGFISHTFFISERENVTHKNIIANLICGVEHTINIITI